MIVIHFHPEPFDAGNGTVETESHLMTGIITPIANINPTCNAAALIAFRTDGVRITGVCSFRDEEAFTHLPIIVDKLAFSLNIDSEARAVLEFD